MPDDSGGNKPTAKAPLPSRPSKPSKLPPPPPKKGGLPPLPGKAPPPPVVAPEDIFDERAVGGADGAGERTEVIEFADSSALELEIDPAADEGASELDVLAEADEDGDAKPSEVSKATGRARPMPRPPSATMRPVDEHTVRADIAKLAEAHASRPKPAPPKSSAGRKASLPPPRRAPRPGVPAPPRAGAATTAPAATAGREDDPKVARGRMIIERCEHELRRAGDDVVLARLHHEIALAHELLVGRPSAALEHYQLALAKAPEHVPAIRGARRLKLAAARRPGAAGSDRAALDDALRLFDAEIAVTSDAGALAALWYEKGRIEASRGGVHLQAAKRSLIRALEAEPHNVTVLEALARVARESNDDPGLDDALERLASALVDDPRARAAVVAARARHVEVRLGEPDRAVDLYERALVLDPDAGGVQAALERILYAKQRWRELVTALERRVDRATAPRRAASALVEIAALQADRLGDEDEAVASLRRAAELSPEDGLILDELGRRLEARADHRGFAAVLARRVELLENPRERLAPLHRLGTIHEVHLEDADGAAHWYERALDVDAAYVPSLRALGKLYTQAERHRDLVRMHLAAAERFDDQARKADAHARAAELLESRLERPELAVKNHERALALMPGLDDSFKALVRLYTAARDHAALVELYERAVDRAEHRDLELTYLFKIAALQEDALADPVAASRTFMRVLELDGRNLGAVHGLQRTCEAAGDHKGLVSALEREVDLCAPTERDRKVVLLHRAGTVLDERLDDFDAALERLRKARELAPRHPRVLASLGRLFHRRARWRQLFEVFGQELELAETAGEKVELNFKMGELAERELHDEELALTRYRAAVDSEPGHRPSLSALARLLEARQEWKALCRVVEQQIEASRTPAEISRAAYRLGVVLENRVTDLPAAAKAYRRALEADPEHQPSLAGLARVLEATRAWEETVEAMRDQAERSQDERLVGEAMLRASEVLAERLERREEALAALEERRRRIGDERAALLRLGSLYERERNWDRLARLYIERASRLDHAPGRRAALIQLAELVAAEEVPGDHDPRGILETVLGMKPDDRIALSALDGFVRSEPTAAAVAAVSRRHSELERDPAALAAELTRLGDALAENDPAEAAGAYIRALEVDPSAYVAMRGLAEIAIALDDPELQVDVRRMEADWTADGDRAAELLVRAAVISRSRLDDEDAAIADLEKALTRGPDHEAAATAIDGILVARKELSRLVEVLSAAARATPRPPRRLALWLRVAELQAGRELDDVPAAIASLQRVVDLDPKALEPVLALAKLHVKNQSWTEAVAYYERVIRLGPTRTVSVQAHLELARILLERLGQHEQAGEHVDALLKIQPGHREALLISVDLHIREAEYEEAEALATRLLRASSTGAERGQALAKLGALQLRNGERSEGLASLVEAVSHVGPRTEPGRRYRDEVGNEGATAQYAEALEKFLASVEADGAEDDDPGATYLELARVHDALGDTAQSVVALQRALMTREDDADLRAGLASRLMQLGRYPQAEAQWRELLTYEVGRVEAWRGLARALGHLQRADEGRLALGPVVVLGDASPEEAATATRTKTRPGLARPGSFNAETLQKISAGPVVEGRVIGLLVAMRDVYGKVFAPDLGAYGLTARDKIPPGTQHPLRALVDRVAPAFGVERFDLYVHQVKHGLVVELGATPSVVVPAYLGQLSEAQQVFMLARAFCNVARGTEAATRLGADQLTITLAATAKVFGHDQTRGLDKGAVEEMSKRIARGIPWIGRKALEEAVAAYAAMPRMDMRAWLVSLDKTATRAATLLSGDVAGAVDIIRRTDPRLHQLSGPALVASSDVVEDLLRFWLSKSAMNLRAQAGLG